MLCQLKKKLEPTKLRHAAYISHGPKLVRSHFCRVNLGLHIESGAGELEEAKSLLGFDIFCWDFGNIVGIFDI